MKENPTKVKIGMTGQIAGNTYDVVGRVVMGMSEGGTVYYWNEFHLVSDRGQPAILVFEETEYGAKWKLFTRFEPSSPMTVQEAAAKRVGNRVHFDGTSLPITLVDESRVYFVEGQTPKGFELGDKDRYFNAELGNKMYVVSWDDKAIEFYRGMDLPTGTIRKAFGLTIEYTPSFVRQPPSDFDSGGCLLKGMAIFFAVVIAFATFASCRSPYQPSPMERTTLKAPALPLGGEGRLEGRNFHLANHLVAEIAQMNRLYEQHEYFLSDMSGEAAPALLIYGFRPGDEEWTLFTPATGVAMHGREAAIYRVGDKVRINGVPLDLTQLFQRKVQRTEGESVDDGSLFGFNADSLSRPCIVRWNEEKLTFYRGKKVTEQEVRSAFDRK